MRQLTALDAQFLAMESPTHTGHVSMLLILDPSTAHAGAIDLADLQQVVADRLHLLPPFRWKLQEVPLGMDYPYWIDDPDFDVEYHVRDLAVPQPGTDEKLAEVVARIVARPLDRSRPLWELYLIHGLADGHVAMLTKIHHAAVDGVSGVELLSILLDSSPTGGDVHHEPSSESEPERPPSQLAMLGRGLLGTPRYWARAMKATPSTIPNLTDVPLLGAIPGAKSLGRTATRISSTFRREPLLLEQTALEPPRTSFNGRVSAHRRVAIGRMALADAKAVKNANSCTLNDVIVAVCAGAVRRWLIEHDELPDVPLVVEIPVSVRTAEQAGTFGNRVGVMTAPLYTNEPDPTTRLRRTSESLRSAKERHRALPASLMQDSSEMIHPALFAQATRAVFALTANGTPIWNLVVSNVPGPRTPLYLAGATVEAVHPVSVISDGIGLNITVFSYCDHIDIGIVVDREQMPDAWKLIEWMHESLDELQLQDNPSG
ncbi:WS/DGAT/MGAT family O-acyltransferase [Antrihabitans stalactiti]|uniref:Diacylglycerol O-acyltransferase n=1 Tax=Antrihabitans stalactiti TaxID=2584121 RepID=A0A848KMN0_9NOCA|nr:wax ester/triacylglycerol synthase family O-acyltransferase [Antrihabitans stalactiti]NMN99489.1 wax ester/triacylglycerol synthase family O-acyltransferase [Antrihabitans stalactiti]